MFNLTQKKNFKRSQKQTSVTHSNHRRIPLHERHGSRPILSPRSMVVVGWEGPGCLRQTRTIDDGPAFFSSVPVVQLFAAEPNALRVTLFLNDCLGNLLCVRSPLPPRRRLLPWDPIVLAVLRNVLGGRLPPRSGAPRFVPKRQRCRNKWSYWS